MKILYVLNDTLKYGGTESVCLNYLNHIDKKQYQIDFLLHTTENEMKSNEICLSLRKQGINIFCVTPRRISIHKNIKELKKFFCDNKYDIVHSHADAASYIILKIAKKFGHEHLIAHSHNTNVFVNHTGALGLLHRIYLDYCRLKLRSITKNYMACTEKAGIWLFGKRNLKKGNIYILNNAIELTKFKFNIDLRKRIRKELQVDDSIVIGHVGRFSYQKNHEFIIELFKRISLSNDKYRLVLIGIGEKLNMIKELVNQNGLYDKVIFVGNTNEVYKYYNAMDFFVFPSFFEGLALALIEAQANGLKCLATDNDQVSKETNVASLIEFKKIDSVDIWADYIEKNINYDREKDYSKQIANSGYDIDIEVKKLQSYYDSLIE